jgi:hypothetical protein
MSGRAGVTSNLVVEMGLLRPVFPCLSDRDLGAICVGRRFRFATNDTSS